MTTATPRADVCTTPAPRPAPPPCAASPSVAIHLIAAVAALQAAARTAQFVGCSNQFRGSLADAIKDIKGMLV